MLKFLVSIIVLGAIFWGLACDEPGAQQPQNPSATPTEHTHHPKKGFE